MSKIIDTRARARRYARSLTAEAAKAVEESYAAPLKAVHWVMGFGTLGCFGCVQAAMNTPKGGVLLGKGKGEWMNLHKSFGLVVAGLCLPRVALRLTTAVPAHLPGSALEHVAANASHLAMYFGMLGMSATGLTMGLMGKGLPFFGTTIPALKTQVFADRPNGKTAGAAFKLHKTYGPYFEYLVPFHIGAVGYHMAKGQAILKRIL